MRWGLFNDIVLHSEHFIISKLDGDSFWVGDTRGNMLLPMRVVGCPCGLLGLLGLRRGPDCSGGRTTGGEEGSELGGSNGSDPPRCMRPSSPSSLASARPMTMLSRISSRQWRCSISYVSSVSVRDSKARSMMRLIPGEICASEMHCRRTCGGHGRHSYLYFLAIVPVYRSTDRSSLVLPGSDA